jgi:hypothetical protein
VESETEKLPKGQSYPLKPSVLADALARAGIEIDTHLIRSSSQRLFDAYFWPTNGNVPYERLYIRVGSVPSDKAAIARRWAEDAVVPRLVRWIAAILAMDPKSPIRREEQSIHLSLPESSR